MVCTGIATGMGTDTPGDIKPETNGYQNGFWFGKIAVDNHTYRIAFGTADALAFLPGLDDGNGTAELPFNEYSPPDEACDGLHGEWRELLYEPTLAVQTDKEENWAVSDRDNSFAMIFECGVRYTCKYSGNYNLQAMPSESYAAAAAAANDDETFGGAGVNGPLRTDIWHWYGLGEMRSRCNC